MLQSTAKRGPGSLPMLGHAFVLALALLAYLAAPAAAEVSWIKSFGSSGSTGGKFNRATGLGINNETEHVYVADRQNNRIQEFDAEGTFIQAFGFDVVSSGPDNQEPANEKQTLPIAATSGTFTLTFEAITTSPLAYNAEAATVQEKLEELSTIGAGNVTVSGGPGDATASSPYVVEFVGAKAGLDLPQITISSVGLGVAEGETLRCAAIAEVNFFTFADSLDYQWLANGAPISGATSSEYTVAAGDAGKALQCQVKAHWPALSGGKGTTNKTYNVYTVASPVPGTAIPLGPSDLGNVGTSSDLEVGTSGQLLTCNAGAWSGSPTSYTYRWYRDGAEIHSHETAETSDQYEVTPADLGQPTDFQCSVTAKNAGGASTVYSLLLATKPVPNPTTVIPKLSVTTATRGLTPRDGGVVFEICKQAEGDTCKVGVKGAGAGQFAEPRGVAVDNSLGGEGAIYVQDDNNYRIQKFTSSLEPLLTIGKEVNKSTFGTVCVFASSDVCGVGIKELQNTPGTFGGWGFQSQNFAEESNYGNAVAVDTVGNLYVGTSNEPNPPGPEQPYTRVQKFNSSGVFLGQALVPSQTNGRPEPLSVTADSTGRVYTAIGGEQAAVQIFEPPEFTLTGKGTSVFNNIYPNFSPRQVALDPRASQLDRVLIGDANVNETACSKEAPESFKGIVEFDNEKHQIDCTVPEGLGQLKRISGLAVSPNGNVYAADWESNQVKIYELPTPTPPTVGKTFVTSITQNTARVNTEIEAGFEATELTLEFGDEACPGSCTVQVVPQKVYGLKFKTRTIQVQGLEAGTKYHYRLVAKNSKGEDEFADGTFTTYEFIDLVKDSCANALARKQTRSIGLLDCRGYELASARSTGGYDVTSDVVPNQTPFDGRPDASDKLLYSVVDGGIAGTGNPTNRGQDSYVATRTSEEGQFGEDKGTWMTKYMGIPADNPFASKPFSSTLGSTDSALGTLAFSGPEICSPCFAGESTGGGGVPLRMPNGELVQGMVGSEPVSSPEPSEGSVRKSLSGDGSHFVFGSEQKFEPEGNDENGNVTIYDRDLQKGTTQVVSSTAGGEPIEVGDEVAELDISEDGSRIIFATLVGEDGAGNKLWHPYMHIGTNPISYDLAPGTTTGVYFDGMTGDGSRVFLSTKDKLLGSDTDENVDIYETDVSKGGSVALHLLSVSSGGPSNDESCEPPGEPHSWNTTEGEGKCGAVALAGGAGVASGDGTFYFLSPELLDEAAENEGEPNEPNLYVVPPDQAPEFVGTIDSSVGKTQEPPEYALSSGSFGGSHTGARGLAVDESNGDVYVAESGQISRFDSSGSAHNFTAGPGVGTNHFAAGFGGTSKTTFGVDNASGSPFDGDFYVQEGTSKIGVYKPTGEKLGEITGFEEACGLAIDESTGDVYVGDYEYAGVKRFAPISNSPVEYAETSIKTEGMHPCQVAADTAGHVYASNWSSGPLREYEASAFAASPPTLAGVFVTSTAPGMSVDSKTDRLYVDQGSKVTIFTPGGGEEIKVVVNGEISSSAGVAVNSVNHHLYASTGASGVADFEGILPPYDPIQNPAVVHGAKEPEVHRYGDFQVSPSGRYAMFATRQPLDPSYDNQGHFEVYRFDAETNTRDCVSCNQTEAAATSESSLPAHGLGLLDDGRAFFNSYEQLVLRDQNGKQDGYEWDNGAVRLISTGLSAYDSGLLSVGRNGKDAFFFTREQVVAEDENEEAMRVYDARELGGVFVVPSSPPCAASDECHGPGTVAAPAPQIGTYEGTGGNLAGSKKKKCGKGKARRHGRCVRKRHRKHHRKHRRHSKRAVAKLGTGGNR
jgi:hypothetical protein